MEEEHELKYLIVKNWTQVELTQTSMEHLISTPTNAHT